MKSSTIFLNFFLLNFVRIHLAASSSGGGGGSNDTKFTPHQRMAAIYAVNYVLKIYSNSSHKVCRNSFIYIFISTFHPFFGALLSQSVRKRKSKLHEYECTALTNSRQFPKTEIKIQAKPNTHILIWHTQHTLLISLSVSLLRMLSAKTWRKKNHELRRKKKLSQRTAERKHKLCWIFFGPHHFRLFHLFVCFGQCALNRCPFGVVI